MKDERNVNYPGMFDLLKGIVVIGIILTHILDIIPSEALYKGSFSLLKVFVFSLPRIFSLGTATIPILFMVSGYGFKAISLKKCVRKQAKQLLRPYLLTGAAIVAVHFVCHFCAFHYLPGAAKQTGIVALSHLLGIHIGYQFHGVQLCSTGSVWFLLALFEGWILLTLITNTLPEKCQSILAVCMILLFCFLKGFAAPWITYTFCFASIFQCCGNLYWGAQIKKRNWLWVPLSPFARCLLIVLAVTSQILPFLPIPINSTALYCGTFLFVIIGTECTAFLLMRVGVRANRWKNWLLDKIRMVGRYSIWVICAHSIECQGLLWYLFVEKMQGHELAAFLIMAVVRGILIFAICYLINLFDKRIRKARKQRKASAPV